MSRSVFATWAPVTSLKTLRATMNDDVATLEKEYCPPIDTATFYAIILDYNLTSESGFAEARNTLDAIRSSAETEEATGFDPSGSSSQDHGLTAPSTHDAESSRHDTSASKSTGTNLTSHTGSTASVGADICATSPYEHEIEALSIEDKQALLAETFPDVPMFTVSYALKTCDGKFERAVEELLTRSFLEDGNHSDGEQYKIPKGIDGFAQSVGSGGSSKSKRRKQRKLDLGFRSASTPGSAESLPLATNKWDKGSREIEYIAHRTAISEAAIASCYHQQGASLSKTILALSKNETLLKSVSTPDESFIATETATMATDFPTIEVETLAAILRMTHPSTAAAHELALATIKSPFPTFREREDFTGLLPQYSKLKIDDDAQPDNSSDHNKPGYGQPPGPLPTRDAASAARSYAAVRQQAFEKASAAYRRSRSDRLMGGAAGYYASVGRDAMAMADSYSAQAADAFVARQSNATSIDLHGVDVKNAVRIALERTTGWWKGGASEYAHPSGKIVGGDGFRIVTGIGRHSAAGKARIGPAVKKALTADGWRVEDTGGVLLVRGKERR